MTDLVLKKDTLDRMFASYDDDIIDIINKYASDYGINKTKERMALYIAWISVRSLGFKKLSHDYEFFTSKSVHSFYTQYKECFKSIDEARALLSKSVEEVCNYIYMGISGNTENDGYKYRPRGLVGFQGKDFYAKLAEISGLPLLEKPELIEDLETAVKVSMQFWNNENYNKLADNIAASPFAKHGAFSKLTNETYNGKDNLKNELSTYFNFAYQNL